MLKKFFGKKVIFTMAMTMLQFVLMAAVTFAAADNGAAVSAYISSLTSTIKGIAVAFVTLSAVTTAILYMVGTVNPKLKDKSKDALYALIIGVVILVLSGDIATWISSITNRNL